MTEGVLIVAASSDLAQRLGGANVQPDAAPGALEALLDPDTVAVVVKADDPLAVARRVRAHPVGARVPIVFVVPPGAGLDPLLALERVDVVIEPLPPGVLEAKVRLLAGLRDDRVEAVGRERANLHDVLEHVPAGIAILRGPDHVYELSNAENTRLLGGRPRLGAALREILPEGSPLFAAIGHVYGTGEPLRGTEIPFDLPLPEGGARPGFVNGGYEPLRGSSGEVEAVLGFAYEVTDLVLARRRAERAEAQFRAVTDSLPALVALVDRETRYRFANRAYETWFGARPEDVVGKTLLEVIGPEAFDALRDRVAAALAGETISYEARVRFKDGVARDIQATYVPQRGPEGQVDGYVALILDVTAQRRAEREREELLAREQAARAEAEAAVLRRDEFLSVASHELKTPLTSLGLYLETLVRALRSGRDVEAQVEKMRAHARRLTALIDDLLDVSRLTAGSVPLDPAPMDLVALVWDVVARFEPLARAAGSTIDVAGPPSLEGVWDRARLDQVLTNLLSNALKYGRGTPVRVELSREADLARLDVGDEGVGVDPDDHGRIFERFERASSARPFSGLGVGLWIVRTIVEAHGGSVHVDSRLGEGATFRVELPIRRG